MRKRTLLFFIFLVGLVFISSNTFAAWTQAKGHSYNQLTFSHYKTIERFTSLGYDRGGIGAIIDRLNTGTHRIPTEEFTSTKISFYGEYGLTDKITGIISGGWDWQTTNDVQKYSDSDGPSGVGDIILGLRHKLTDNLGAGVLSSIQVDLKIPEAYDYGDPITEMNLGFGQYDVTAKLLFGKGFNWGYAVLSAGYNYRFENTENGNMTFKPSDQMIAGISAGYNVLSWLSIRGNLDYIKPVGNAQVSNELIAYNKVQAAGADWHQDTVLVKDLGLEAESFSGGIALAFTVKPGTQVVAAYNRDLYGRDSSIGTTFSLALAISL